MAGWARAEERRRGRAVAFGEQMGALRLRCPPGRGREGDARRGQEARSSSFAMVRQGREGKEGEVHLSGEKICAGDAAVGGDGTARKREPAEAGVR